MLVSARGVRINAVVGGEGPPVVLVHGFGCTRAVWDPVVALLRPGFRTVAVDLRGAGASDRTYGALTIEDLADDLHQVMHALDLGPAVVVGHSMGGMVSEHLCLAAPNLVRGLVLCGTAGRVTPEYRSATRALADIVREQGSAGLAAAMAAGLFGSAYQQARPDEVRSFAQTMEAADPLALTVTLEGIETFDLAGRLASVEVPTAVVVGEHDPFLEDSRVLARTIPGATLVELSGTGHMTPMEAPGVVAENIEAVARRSGAGTDERN